MRDRKPTGRKRAPRGKSDGQGDLFSARAAVPDTVTSAVAQVFSGLMNAGAADSVESAETKPHAHLLATETGTRGLSLPGAPDSPEASDEDSSEGAALLTNKSPLPEEHLQGAATFLSPMAPESEEAAGAPEVRSMPFQPAAPASPAAPAGPNDPVSPETPPAITVAPEEVLTARMLNEFVYCPRLFYYEHVEGVFVESADTVRGATLHRKVDKGKGALAKPDTEKSPADEDVEETGGGAAEELSPDPVPKIKPGEIHSKSVMLGSDRLGVLAKMDLVDATIDEAGQVTSVCPVDYKVGSPRAGSEGADLWDADRMQLGVQCLVLRDNGYRCDEGMIYYRGTKQKVPLPMTPELEAWIIEQIAAARRCSAGPKPGPLIDSPKCVRCSLAPVCLPDETRMLSIAGAAVLDEPSVVVVDEPRSTSSDRRSESAESRERSDIPTPRRLIAPKDEKRALYLNTPGYRVGCHDGVLRVKEQDRLIEEIRLMDVCHVALFGNIQISSQAVHRLCDAQIPITYFSMGGWFYGITRGHSLKNVDVRIAQFRHAADPASCLRFAQQFVRGKIHNHRVYFMRNHGAPPERTKLRLGQAREDALQTKSLGELLGVEGAAASEYFAQFSGQLCEQMDDDFLEGVVPDAPTHADTAVRFNFDFKTRNRRPPTDPVNALLSLAYSLLAKECTLAAYAVGLDPYVGFYHQPRHGRPALALDLMEEFRPLIAESAVLTAINNRYVSPRDFVQAGRAVNLSVSGRRQFFQCFEQRMNTLITHPIFDYRVSYRRALELQFRILARVLTGEIPEYVPFMTR